MSVNLLSRRVLLAMSVGGISGRLSASVKVIRVARFTLPPDAVRGFRPSARQSSQQAPEAAKSVLREKLVKGLIASVGLAAVGTVYKYGEEEQNRGGVTVSGAKNVERLKYKPDRTIRSATDNTGLKLTLYQYQSCPFCCKVRAYLDYRGLSYQVIEVNSVRRNQISWSKYKKVPILVFEGTKQNDTMQLNDSSVIVSLLESFLLDRSQSVNTLATYYPEIEMENARGKTVFEYPNRYFLMYGKAESFTNARKEEQKWRLWTDDVLVHTISPNIYLTPSQALEAFRSFSEVGEWDRTFNVVERYFTIFVGATAMYFVGKMLRKRYNLKENVRESLYDAGNAWMSAVKQSGGQFLGGTKPNLADLAVYGELHAMEGCQAFRDLMYNTDISTWYLATRDAIAKNAGTRVY